MGFCLLKVLKISNVLIWLEQAENLIQKYMGL
ncbi:unnamed protein product, partial [marine sediment metagenome]